MTLANYYCSSYSPLFSFLWAPNHTHKGSLKGAIFFFLWLVQWNIHVGLWILLWTSQWQYAKKSQLWTWWVHICLVLLNYLGFSVPLWFSCFLGQGGGMEKTDFWHKWQWLCALEMYARQEATKLKKLLPSYCLSPYSNCKFGLGFS